MLWDLIDNSEVFQMYCTFIGIVASVRSQLVCFKQGISTKLEGAKDRIYSMFASRSHWQERFTHVQSFLFSYSDLQHAQLVNLSSLLVIVADFFGGGNFDPWKKLRVSAIMSLWEYCSSLPDPDGTPSFSLTQEEEQFLTKQGIILSECVAGERKVDAAILSTSFHEIVEEGFTSKWAKDGLQHYSVKIVPVDTSTLPPVIVPESVLCIAALRLIGWQEEAATKIFKGWQAESKHRPNRSDRDPSLIDYVISHVYKRMDSFTPIQLAKMNARNEMTELGLRKSFQDSMLSPEDDISCGIWDLHYWIADSMYKSYKIYVTRLKFLKNYAIMGLQAEMRIRDAEQKFSRVPDEDQPEAGYESNMIGRKAQHTNTAITTNISTAMIRTDNGETRDLTTAMAEVLSRENSSQMQVDDVVWSRAIFRKLRHYRYTQKV
ncbi:hypothetical protein DSL72_002115 [Monilinia vaccinii-corymbosi]|uniref:Uncharacterized protein n=1 Tax=Monilinia vaccinii-corymbosi TaxID=61207 RepID=A0A8A3PBS2_9HELO|nr:hypothetical protein DSL72_002115 [Monilinia vaccinii-corymbosi]